MMVQRYPIIIYFILSLVICGDLMESVSTANGFSFSGSPATDLQPLMKCREPSSGEKVGWLGADCATSFRMDSDKYLWLFGDTLLGNITEQGTRDTQFFVHNTAAIVDIPATPENVSFYWGVEPYMQFQPDALFNTMNPIYKAMYYWPVSGIVPSDDSELLVIFAYRIQRNSSEPLGFSANGTTLLIIPNRHDIPSKWRYSEYHMTETGSDLNFVVSVARDIIDPNTIYVVGNYKNQAVLASYKVDDLLQSKWSEMHVWAHDAQGEMTWMHWPVDPSTLVTLGKGASEGSLVYNAYMSKWYTLLLDFNATDFHIATADSPIGPWEMLPTPIYSVAPPYNDTSTYFCYAPKSHPELAVSDSEIIMSYNCNSPEFLQIAPTDLNFYTPQMVRIKVQKD